MTEIELQQWFAYKPGTPEQAQACILVRTAVYKAAEQYRQLTPEGQEQRDVLRQVKATLQAMIGHIVAPLPESDD